MERGSNVDGRNHVCVEGADAGRGGTLPHQNPFAPMFTDKGSSVDSRNNSRTEGVDIESGSKKDSFGSPSKCFGFFGPEGCKRDSDFLMIL